jgi:tRNA (mo5U34)-methyltransferase
MIEFSNFYQLIAKNHLSHWLETCPRRLPPGSAISSTVC